MEPLNLNLNLNLNLIETPPPCAKRGPSPRAYSAMDKSHTLFAYIHPTNGGGMR